MSDEHDWSEEFRKRLADYGRLTAANLRQMGIEMTPDEAEAYVRDGLKDALREFWKQRFLEIIRGER